MFSGRVEPLHETNLPGRFFSRKDRKERREGNGDRVGSSGRLELPNLESGIHELRKVLYFLISKLKNRPSSFCDFCAFCGQKNYPQELLCVLCVLGAKPTCPVVFLARRSLRAPRPPSSRSRKDRKERQGWNFLWRGGRVVAATLHCGRHLHNGSIIPHSNQVDQSSYQANQDRKP